MDIKAVIFDLDGVIVDTAEHHYLAWKRLAWELGIQCPPERKDQVRGVSRPRSLAIVLTGNPQAVENDLRELVTSEEAERLMAKKDSFYHELIKGIGPADLLSGVKDLILDLRQNAIKVGVATVSKNARDVLGRLEILEEFDAIVDGHSGARSKPDPDLFLYAAKRLGVPPAECLVVEDAPAGIEAAEAAGMYGVALGPKERFSDVKADLIIPSLADLTYEKLVTLFSREVDKGRTWLVEEQGLDPATLNRTETIFAVGNGYLATRGSLEEGHPGEIRATFIHGIYDDVPISHTELVNAPDWTGFQLTIAGEPFSLQGGETLSHKRWLDLRDGVLRRLVCWRSPSGRTVEVHTTRFASMADPHLCVQTYAVTTLDFAGEIELNTGFPPPENPGLPPYPEVGLLHWKPISQGHSDRQTLLFHLVTRRSKLELGMAMGFLILGVKSAEVSPVDNPGGPGVQVRARLEPGETVVVVKFATVHTSQDAEAPSQLAMSHLQEARRQGYAQALRDHRAAWRNLWADADVVIDGDEVAQRAVRLNLYHLLIAAPRTERTSIPAKALTGFGYRGHVFWDTDLFMLPFFTFAQPDVARRIVSYRCHTLPGANENARKNGLRGAMYPWESAQDGRETTPRWVPREDGTLTSILTGEREHHITADVAYAVWQYWQATGDDEFMRDCGAEIVISTARFWASRVEADADKYAIRHVIGPDEYHDDVDQNAYTNWLARWNLEASAKTWGWLSSNFPDRAAAISERLGLRDDEVQQWGKIGEHIFIPFDEKTGLIEQFSGYFSLEDIDLAALEPRTRSIWDLLGPERTNGSQVIKQPDVLMLFHLFPDEFPDSVVKANWDYYEPRTDHKFGSSLGPAIHAALAARLGELEKAYTHFMRAALVDLRDIRGNTRDGIHAASAGGLWQALAFGFAGIHVSEEGPVAWPRLPKHWGRLAFSIHWRGTRFSFSLTPDMRGPIPPEVPP